MGKTMEEIFAESDRISGRDGADLALQFLVQCQSGVAEEFGAESLEYAALLNELGSVSRAAFDYAAAADYFRQAMAVLEAVVGKEHPEYGTAVMNLAGILRVQGKPAESLELFQEALAVFGSSLGEESPLYLTALNNIALSYQDMGDARRALEYHLHVCRRLEVLAEQDICRVEYGTSLYNTGLCFRQVGEDELAAALIQQAILAYEGELAEDHVWMVHAKETLAQLKAAAAGSPATEG